MTETSMLATMNPFMLLAGVCLSSFAAFISARRYRGTNDFKKSCKLWAVFMAIINAVFLLCSLPLILIAGFDLLGFILLMSFSNYYFYKN